MENWSVGAMEYWNNRIKMEFFPSSSLNPSFPVKGKDNARGDS
jgi:hypothetical protein